MTTPVGPIYFDDAVVVNLFGETERMPNIVKVLDCTLRDGGYYTNWDFSPSLVKAYLESMCTSGVEFVELGLRQLGSDVYRGPYAYTTPQFLNRLSLPQGPTYGVMIDAKTLLSYGEGQKSLIDRLFLERKLEVIGLVRIAAHFSEALSCQPALVALKEKGYVVGFNLMQSAGRSEAEISHVAAQIESWDLVDVLYFADSLGAMREGDVARVYHAVRKAWSGEVGFHAHNNMGQALTNVDAAIELGCTWVDATVSGMGRGAGNAETENVLPTLRPRDFRGYAHLNGLVFDHFRPLKAEHQWGSSLAYKLAAELDIHPTYIQNLLSRPELKKGVVMSVISQLAEMESPNSFSEKNLEAALAEKPVTSREVRGQPAPNCFEGHEVVMVVHAGATEQYRGAIQDYCSKSSRVLVSINLPEPSDPLDYRFYFICHNEKYREHSSRYENYASRLIAPKGLFDGEKIGLAHDYGIHVEQGVFEAHSEYAVVPYSLTLAYAIGFSVAAGAKAISIVGMVGYEAGDRRHRELQELFSLLGRQNIDISAITPSNIAIPESSIYAL